MPVIKNRLCSMA